jgi:Ca2+-binding EF-hand superfamily protein
MKILAASAWLAMIAMTTADADATGDARTARQKPVTSFGYLDTDKDARISREEARADWAVKQRFAEADANRDGYIDPEEFKRLSRADKSPGGLPAGSSG